MVLLICFHFFDVKFISGYEESVAAAAVGAGLSVFDGLVFLLAVFAESNGRELLDEKLRAF